MFLSDSRRTWQIIKRESILTYSVAQWMLYPAMRSFWRRVGCRLDWLSIPSATWRYLFIPSSKQVTSQNLNIIQTSTIVRCRYCRTYINPFVIFPDSRHWKCNLCNRQNDRNISHVYHQYQHFSIRWFLLGSRHKIIWRSGCSTWDQTCHGRIHCSLGIHGNFTISPSTNSF